MKELYLHIGTPKTGTTAIQAFCFRNRDKLKENGIDYPVFSDDERYSFGKYAQAGNGCIAATKGDAKETAKVLDLLVKESGCNRIIVSSEEFVHFNYMRMGDIISVLKENNEDLQIYVIAYLRNQTDYFESFYRELVQEYYVLASYSDAFNYLISGADIDKYDEKYLYNLKASCDYYGWINDILKALPKERLILKNYDRLMKEKKNIIDDFFQCLDFTPNESFSREKTFANPSIGIELLEAKRNVNSWRDLFPDGRIRDYFTCELRAKIKEDYRHGKTSIFSNEQRKQIWVKYRENNRIISKMFFDGDDLFAEPDLREEEVIDLKRYIDDSVKMLSGAILQVTKEYEENIKKQQEEFLAITRKIKSDYFLELLMGRDINVVSFKNDLASADVVGWGAGDCFNNCLEFVKGFCRIELVCDKDEDKQGTIKNGIKIVSPDILRELDNPIIVIFTYDYATFESIKADIQKYGDYICIPVYSWFSYVNE